MEIIGVLRGDRQVARRACNAPGPLRRPIQDRSTDAADPRTGRSGLRDSSGRCLPEDRGRTRRGRTVAHSRRRSPGADRRRRVAVVSYIEGFWQTLAVRTSDSASGDSAAAGVIEMLFRQGPFQQPFPNDDPAEVAAWDALGERTVLVARIEGFASAAAPIGVVCHGPSVPSPYAEVAEAIAHHASEALKAARERHNLTRAMAARHRVGLAQGILMVRRQITADQAFALLKRESQNTHVKLRTIAQTVIQTGDLPSARRVRSDGS